MKVLPEQLIKESVLLVEGDEQACRHTAAVLEQVGFRVTRARDGEEALERAECEAFDLVVMEVALPAVDGLTVCRRLRQNSELPIVLLTSRSEESDVVAGLEMGADDYVTKPFRRGEFLARIRAVLRRSGDRARRAAILSAGPLEIDIAAMQVTVGGHLVSLTATEFRLLVELARRPGRVLSRQRLVEHVWGFEFLGDSRLVDMAVKRLRDKLGDDPRDSRYITTVRGAGYRFEAA
jgi:two-component system response regulator MtrA